MKTIIIAALMLSAFAVVGQELKKVTDNTSPNPLTKIKEEYYVLKDAKKVKHGLYKKWVNNRLVSEGNYKYNQKDSTWIRYGTNLNVLGIENYAKDERVGIWKYYLVSGELEQVYDFTTKQIVSFKTDVPQVPYPVISGRDTTYEVLSRPPMVIGGTRTYMEIIAKNLRYPVGAFRNNTGGRVYVRFIVDETGKTSDYRVVKEGDKSLDAEAVRVVKLINDWHPALKDDKPVKVIHTLPITFSNGGFKMLR